jgi:hypothetical protein
MPIFRKDMKSKSPRGGVRNPPKATIEDRSAFLDIEERLSDLEENFLSISQTPRPVETFESINEDLEVASDLRVGNDLRVEGSVDAPHLYEGLIEVVPAAITSPAQRVINMKSSLAIAPGSLSADTVRCRKVDIDDPDSHRRHDPSYVVVEDDFIHSSLASGAIGTLNWALSGDAGSASLHSKGGAGHPGLYGIKPDNDTGDAAYIFANLQVYPMLKGISEYWQTWVIRMDSTLGYTNMIVGLNSTIDYAAGTDGIYIYIDQVALTNFYARTISSSSTTDTDTGIAFARATYYRLDFHYTPSSVKFYIDGVLVATHTTNIPSDDMMPVMAVECDATGNGQSLDYSYVDYYGLSYRIAR